MRKKLLTTICFIIIFTAQTLMAQKPVNPPDPSPSTPIGVGVAPYVAPAAAPYVAPIPIKAILR